MAPRKKNPLDKNGDGRISASEATAAETQSDDEILAGLDLGLPGATPSRGAVLLPYDVSDPATLDTLDFENQSATRVLPGRERTKARYYEQDTLAPLRWSPEQRAQMQRAMHQIGLYGKRKVRLGSWGAADQAAFAELLVAANVEGRMWFEQLAEWKRRPPVELLEEMAGDTPKKPTIQVSNPLDVRAAAAAVDQELTGGGDIGFAQRQIGAYQAAESGAQMAVYGDQDAGGGGTVVDAPSVEQFMADKLRREKPIDVGAYSFLKSFNVFADMMNGVV